MRRKKKASGEPSSIVTSDAVQRHNHTLHSPRLVPLLVLAGIAIIFAALGYAAWRTRPTVPSSSASIPKTTAIHTPQDNLKAAQDAIANAQNIQDKVNAYLALGGAYMGTNQLTQAIAAYKQADSLSNGKNLAVLIQLCNLYNMTKQHSELVATLRQVVTLLQSQVAADSTNAKAAGQLTWYQAALARVEGGGQL